MGSLVTPAVRFAGGRRWALGTASAAIVALWVLRHVEFAEHGGVLAGAWILFLASIVWHLSLAWTARPVKGTPRQQRALDKLFVTVSVPVYNEDPDTVRLVAAALFAQDRLPDRIQFVDDGSPEYDYADVVPEIRSLAAFYPQVEVIWTRVRNGGKRHAQAVAFDDGGRADIFVTLDSDSVLDPAAIREGLKPFADPGVASVAATVLTYNSARNVLTGLTELWMTTFQVFIRAAWSQLGCVLVNSGGLAFYRARVVRAALPAYLSETFFGTPVKFSDDSLLTLYARLSGKTVQQPTSFVFTVMPEKLSHHFRQQLRWMRGSFIRAWWRMKYLPLRSFAYWEHLVMWVTFAVATTMFTGAFVAAPLLRGQFPGWAGIIVPLVLAYATTSPYLLISRSDQGIARQLATFLCAPLAALWILFVLRPLRLYAMVTCRKTGWGTRKRVEVSAVSAL